MQICLSTRVRILVLLAAFLAAPLTGQRAALARSVDAARMNYVERVLPNGLRVITLEDFSCPVVAVQVWYHVGSKDEDPLRQGFAHMFEHMMFRGTERLGPKAHFELIRQVGGDCNAYTAFDNTTYVQKLPSNQLPLALYLEAERMAFLKIDQASFNTERAVVEEERRLGLNRPYGTVLEKVLPKIFTKHPYQWSPIGQIPHLRKASIEELARFWETYYVPNNATLVIVGAVKNDEAQKLAEQYFGWIPRGEDPPRVKEMEPPQTAAREITISEPKGPVTLAAFVWRGVPEHDPDYIPLQLLGQILGGGESSRLNLDLVKQQEIAVATGATAFGLEHDGIFAAFGVVKPFGAGKDAVLAALKKRVEDLKANPPTEDELSKARTELVKGAVEATTTVESKAQLLGRYAVLFGDLPRVNNRVQDIDKVTIADLKRVAEKYLVDERRTQIVVEPSVGEMLRNLLLSKSADDGPAPATQPDDDKKIAARQGPKATAARPESFPTTAPVRPLLDEFPKVAREERTLANGLKVVVVPNDEVPLVTMTLGIRFGAYTDDPSHRGAASLAASMITQGTENFDSKQLATELESHAISLGGSVGMDVGAVNAGCMSAESDRAMRLLAEVVRRPVFPKREFKQQRDQLVTSLSVEEQTPSAVADRELRRRVYGSEHPYAHRASGESAEVKQLSTDALRTWWTSYVRPDTTVLYIAGDVKAQVGFELAERYFGDWKAEGPAPSVQVPPAPAKSGTHIFLVDKPGSVQSEIRAGHVGITREHSDYPFARVLTQIFGGAFNSRLNESLRVKKGLTYGAFGGMMAERFSGTFNVSTFSKTSSTADAVRAIIEEVRLLQTQEATEKEVSEARSFLVGSFAGGRERPQDTINDLWLIEYCGLGSDYLQRSLAQIARTDSPDIQRLAQHEISPEQLTIIVVGDAKKVKDELLRIAPLTVVQESKPAASQPAGQ